MISAKPAGRGLLWTHDSQCRLAAGDLRFSLSGSCMWETTPANNDLISTKVTAKLQCTKTASRRASVTQSIYVASWDATLLLWVTDPVSHDKKLACVLSLPFPLPHPQWFGDLSNSGLYMPWQRSSDLIFIIKYSVSYICISSGQINITIIIIISLPLLLPFPLPVRHT